MKLSILPLPCLDILTHIVHSTMNEHSRDLIKRASETEANFDNHFFGSSNSFGSLFSLALARQNSSCGSLNALLSELGNASYASQNVLCSAASVNRPLVPESSTQRPTSMANYQWNNPVDPVQSHSYVHQHNEGVDALLGLSSVGVKRMGSSSLPVSALHQRQHESLSSTKFQNSLAEPMPKKQRHELASFGPHLSAGPTATLRKTDLFESLGNSISPDVSRRMVQAETLSMSHPIPSMTRLQDLMTQSNKTREALKALSREQQLLEQQLERNTCDFPKFASFTTSLQSQCNQTASFNQRQLSQNINCDKIWSCTNQNNGNEYVHVVNLSKCKAMELGPSSNNQTIWNYPAMER